MTDPAIAAYVHAARMALGSALAALAAWVAVGAELRALWAWRRMPSSTRAQTSALSSSAPEAHVESRAA